MSERFNTRDTSTEIDAPLIAKFAGLSSASLNATADVVYADKLINAFVDKNGEIKRRVGSSARQGLSWTSANGNSHEVFSFKFDGVSYTLTRTGTSLYLFYVDSDAYYYPIGGLNNVFRSKSAAEKASFTTVIEGNYCHVLIATSSTQLISFTLITRRATVATKVSNTITFDIANYPATNVINQNNSIVYTDTGYVIQPTTASQSAATITVTGSPAAMANVAVADNIRMHAFFWLRFADSEYLPGIYLYNTQVRKNSVAADVNVQVPVEIVDNTVYGESIQNLSIQSVQVYKNNKAAATAYTWVAGSDKPATETEWQFSDGSYVATNPNVYTKRTPAYVSFGALEAVATNTTAYFLRMRDVLVGGGRQNPPAVNDLKMYYDGALANGSYLNSNATSIVTGASLAYFWFAGNFNSGTGFLDYPGVNLSAVVELIYTNTSGAGSGAVANVANLAADTTTIDIGNGYCLPLYGYNAIADTRNHRYPNLVQSVGNRVILTGKDNLLAVSNADWTFRGVSFNNFQVSGISFSANSAFYVRLTQGVSRIQALTTVNGVLAVGTDAGIFRVSGESANLPPTADNAIVSKVSSEIVPSSQCFIVYENKVFYVSNNGFFQLEYSQDVNELQNASMSQHVSDFFTGDIPLAITFSQTMRSFIIGFNTSKSLLVLNVDSMAWSTIKMSTTLRPLVNQTFDGFVLLTTSDIGDNYILISVWDKTVDTDLASLSTWSAGVFPSLSVTVTQAATDVSALATPAELLQTIAPVGVTVVQAYGQNTARVIGVTSAVFSEHTGGKVPMPFYSFFVTKAYFDNFSRSHRVRALHLLAVGSGTIQTAIVFPTDDYRDVITDVSTYSLGETNPYAGEPLLNNEYVTREPKGDTKNLRIRLLGISEAWQLAVKLSGVRLAGIQFDSSRKTNRRLH